MAWRDVTSERLRLFISPRKNVVWFKNLNTGVRDYKYTWKANVLNDVKRVKSTLTVLVSIIDSDYTGRHAKSSKHIGQKLEFYPVLSASRTKLNFTGKEDEEPVAKGAKLDCDSSKDIIISSRCAADRSQEGKLNEI